ncbi:MAG: hypothetical protein ACK4M7_05420, partial [Burkholderiales bacterium]
MSKLIHCISLCILSFTSYATSISFLANHTFSSTEKSLVIQALDKQINPALYRDIKIQILIPELGTKQFLVFLLNKDSYCVEIDKLILNDKYQAISLIRNYNNFTENEVIPGTNSITYSCPNKEVEFVVATPLYQEISTARQSINEVADLARGAGLTVVQLLDKDATITNYLNYLSCPNLKGFYSIGHGMNRGIMLHDGFLMAKKINEVLKNELEYKTIVEFNSCQVFNNPLKEATIDEAHAQKFVGGINNLSIGTSELSSSCFWNQAFNGKSLTPALAECNQEYDSRNEFGIGGLGIDLLTHPLTLKLTNHASFAIDLQLSPEPFDAWYHQGIIPLNFTYGQVIQVLAHHSFDLKLMNLGASSHLLFKVMKLNPWYSD